MIYYLWLEKEGGSEGKALLGEGFSEGIPEKAGLEDLMILLLCGKKEAFCINLIESLDKKIYPDMLYDTGLEEKGVVSFELFEAYKKAVKCFDSSRVLAFSAGEDEAGLEKEVMAARKIEQCLVLEEKRSKELLLNDEDMAKIKGISEKLRLSATMELDLVKKLQYSKCAHIGYLERLEKLDVVVKSKLQAKQLLAEVFEDL